MSATPEDPDPFSPSVFLDLPATPRLLDGDGDGEDPASSDDLVLPFISRVLMEEDVDADQFPGDHPALLQAQLPYAQILSDAAAAANTSGSGGTFTLSPSSSVAAAAFANAAWPYDPVELYQLLMSTPPDPVTGDGFTAADANAVSVPGQDGAGVGFRPHQNASSDGAEEEIHTVVTTFPAGDGEEHAALASAFFGGGQNGVNMDMLNLAFLKGMEEANKFLPTTNTNSLLEDQVKEDGGVLILQGSTSAHGRARKHKHTYTHNWEEYDLASDTGRSSKLMVPEPEETGEMVDKMIVDANDMCHQKMKGLRITTGSDAEKKNTAMKSAQGRQSSSNEAFDLRTQLIHCAQAVSMDDRQSATQLLRQIKLHSSPTGNADQRLAHYFAEGLETRLAGTASQMYKSLVTKRTSVMELLKAHQLYLAACCFKMTSFWFSNMTICKAIAGRKKAHIVDYGVHYGFQWPSLLAFLGTWEGGPLELRFTAIDLPEPGFRPSARIEETGRRLSNWARQHGLPFKFHSVAAKWDTVRAEDLNIDPDEVLIVNSIIQFESLRDEGVDIYSPSPRDVVLSDVRKMRPDVFILGVVNSSCSAPFFVTRFREALFHYSAMFDMLDATAPRDDEQRLVVERDFIGPCALNVIACEGTDRVERSETYKQWQVRNQRAGLRKLPLYPDIVKNLREKVKNQYHKDFVVDVDQQWFLQGWKGRILYAISTWAADEEAIPEL